LHQHSLPDFFALTNLPISPSKKGVNTFLGNNNPFPPTMAQYRKKKLFEVSLRINAENALRRTIFKILVKILCLDVQASGQYHRDISNQLILVPENHDTRF
jgi:hypothetical protein